jgi:hypothetical protein
MQPSGGAPERVAGGCLTRLVASVQIAAYGCAGVGNRRACLYYPRQLTDLLRRQSRSAFVPSADSCSAANAACGLQDYNVAIAGRVACAPLDSPLGVFDILLG